MWMSHSKEFFIVDVSSFSPSSGAFSIRFDATARNVSFRNSLRWPIYSINSVNKTKLYCIYLSPTQHHSFFRNLPPWFLFGNKDETAISIFCTKENVFFLSDSLQHARLVKLTLASV